jgi:hypothetical protein
MYLRPNLRRIVSFWASCPLKLTSSYTIIHKFTLRFGDFSWSESMVLKPTFNFRSDVEIMELECR